MSAYTSPQRKLSQMNHKPAIWIIVCLLGSTHASGQTFKADLTPLVEESCRYCHEAGTVTRLNFDDLGHDLTDPATFRRWERIYDRIAAGEMPPETEPPPDAATLQTALDSLQRDLRASSLEDQRLHGRVPMRRLTRLEYAYTLRDLLAIDVDLSKRLPEETDSGGFDTVGAHQGISPIHIRSYLEAADEALDAAITLAPRPRQGPHKIQYARSPYATRWQDRPFNEGGGFTKNLDDAVALFVDFDYLLRSDACGLFIVTPGTYRIQLEAYPYQVKDTSKPVTLKLIQSSEARGGAFLLGAFDLIGDQHQTFEVTARLNPGDYLYPSIADLGTSNLFGGLFQAGGAKNYKGPGIAVKSLTVDGPRSRPGPPPAPARSSPTWS